MTLVYIITSDLLKIESRISLRQIRFEQFEECQHCDTFKFPYFLFTLACAAHIRKLFAAGCQVGGRNQLFAFFDEAERRSRSAESDVRAFFPRIPCALCSYCCCSAAQTRELAIWGFCWEKILNVAFSDDCFQIFCCFCRVK